jgi:hypothetical protein
MHVTCTGKKGNAYRILVGNPELRRLLGNLCGWIILTYMSLRNIMI